MNLQVSSKFFDRYVIAITHVQELLLNIIEEYKIFCAKHNRKLNLDFDLHVRREEKVYGHCSTT